VEVAQGDTVLALVFRVLDPPSPADRQALRAFGQAHALEVWLQPAGPDSITLLDDPDPEGSQLAYALPEFGVRMPFRPTDFTQVNHAINATMVSRAVRLLGLEPHERVADLFCGLGNFTLPLATRAAAVLGIEGSASLVARARANAQRNGLAARTQFAVANLFALTPAEWTQLGPFDRVLIDPPREGALAVVQALAAEGPRPKRLVYVSCNPATLARDAAILVHTGGWQLTQAGVINMFPHTSHVESVAVFEPIA
jgi:23S rRNA (uracil1939-C5)-methyltransferase